MKRSPVRTRVLAEHILQPQILDCFNWGVWNCCFASVECFLLSRTWGGMLVRYRQPLDFSVCVSVCVCLFGCEKNHVEFEHQDITGSRWRPRSFQNGLKDWQVLFLAFGITLFVVVVGEREKKREHSYKRESKKNKKTSDYEDLDNHHHHDNNNTVV